MGYIFCPFRIFPEQKLWWPKLNSQTLVNGENDTKKSEWYNIYIFLGFNYSLKTLPFFKDALQQLDRSTIFLFTLFFNNEVALCLNHCPRFLSHKFSTHLSSIFCLGESSLWKHDFTTIFCKRFPPLHIKIYSFKLIVFISAAAVYRKWILVYWWLICDWSLTMVQSISGCGENNVA